MDDEQVVREVTSRLLNRIGYEVICAKNGSEAIELYSIAKTTNHPFDFVFVDLHIQNGMDGKDTITKLLEMDPLVKAIVISSDIHNPLMVDFSRYGFIGAIPKPFSLKNLASTLAIIDSDFEN